MNKREAVLLLFTIAKEVEHSFEHPVIMFTLKDYAANIFQCLIDIRQALIDFAPPEHMAKILNIFHLQWLDAVQDVEKFRKKIRETPRDSILKAIDFTIECNRRRYKLLVKFIERFKNSMSEEDHEKMESELKLISEMQDIVNSALFERRKHIRAQADQTDYHTRITGEIEEILCWLDRLNDSLAIQCCKILNLKVPIAPSDLTKTLKQIIDEVAADPSPEAQRAAELINIKGKLLVSMIRISSVNELEIAKVVEKIRALEERICRLQAQNSSAVMALKNKTTFLEEQLHSLESIKMAMKKMKGEKTTSALSVHEHKEVRIFNHLLPHHDRCRLVEQLVQIWNCAILEHDHESIISILSVADLKEIFSDDKGNFTVDKYGRKIYIKADDDTLYQLNEHNELVPVKDDDKHVYFYDSCGRYFVTDARERVYKDHKGASEYCLNKSGYLVKVLEVIDGTEYYYDWLGRYRINKKGQHIYCEGNSSEEYEHDGLGNLVKIHTADFYYETCRVEPITTEENKYLLREVGAALKECVAEVVLHQPPDPIIYLSERLVKYHGNIKERQKRASAEQERLVQRELLLQTLKENSPNPSITEDESMTDLNFIEYKYKIDDGSF